MRARTIPNAGVMREVVTPRRPLAFRSRGPADFTPQGCLTGKLLVHTDGKGVSGGKGRRSKKSVRLVPPLREYPTQRATYMKTRPVRRYRGVGTPNATPLDVQIHQLNRRFTP